MQVVVPQRFSDGSLFDYLGSKLASMRVSDKVPAVSSMAQKNLAVLTGGNQPIRVPVWRNIRLIRDELTPALARVRSSLPRWCWSVDPHVPYGVSDDQGTAPEAVVTMDTTQQIEYRLPVEIRESETSSSPGRITGTLIEQGRVAGDRPEVFAPDSIEWPANGIRLQAKHYGDTVMRFTPKVEGQRLIIDESLPDTELGRHVASEIRSRRRPELSIHFHATEDADGIRRYPRDTARAGVCRCNAVQSGVIRCAN